MGGPGHEKQMSERRLSKFRRWLLSQGRWPLWSSLAMMMCLNVTLLAYALIHQPFIRFQPICDDEDSIISPFDPLRSVSGRLTDRFFIELRDTLYNQGVDFLTNHHEPIVYIRFPDWWDENLTWNMTTKTIWRIMEEDRGITRFAATGPKINLSGFSKNGLPTCDTVRAMAIYQEEH